MSGNSYPSPVSSSPSPRLNASPAPTGPNPSARGRTALMQNTHRSLQSATADLEGVFAILEQVRTSLMQLTDPMSDSAVQSRAREQVGPSHDAIMLTGELGNELWEHQIRAQGNEETDLTYDFESSVRRAVQSHNSLAQIAEQTSAPRQSTAMADLPVNTRAQYQSLPIDLQGSRYFDLALRDDSSTVLGRHVVARQAAAQRRAMLPTSDARNAQSTLSSQDPTGRTLNEAQRASQLSDSNELRRLNQVQTQLNFPTTSSLLWRQEPRRRRPNRTDARPPSTRTSASGPGSAVPSDHPSRLSMLSSFSIQNFSAPVSAAPSTNRPLLFEEPESYTEGPPGQHDADMIIYDDVPFGRNYIIRRHMNAEGRERVQNINLDMAGEASSNNLGWIMTPREDASDLDSVRRRTIMQSFQERAQRLAPTAMDPSGLPTPGLSRRRGWARLDPDGNEIPSDEEEELERSRTEYRIRATNRARPGTFMPQGTPPLPPDMVRSTMYGSVMDSVANVSDAFRLARQEHEGALVVDKDDYTLGTCYPLPMPLERMVASREHAENEFVVVMGPGVSFAGR